MTYNVATSPEEDNAPIEELDLYEEVLERLIFRGFMDPDRPSGPFT